MFVVGSAANSVGKTLFTGFFFFFLVFLKVFILFYCTLYLVCLLCWWVIVKFVLWNQDQH